MSTLSLVTWPPPYQLKKNKRAKRVKLRTKYPHGLEITIPFRFNLKALPDILEIHKTWILEQLTQLASSTNWSLPSIISLKAIQQEWLIQYSQSTSKIKIIYRPHQELILLGKVEDKQQCQTVLMKWVKEQASLYLQAQLIKISQETGLSFTEVSIRNQQTRWGSCTVDKKISLNYKLIFLPPSLVRHVLIHELCHTKQLNHSERFWALVEKFDHHWQEHKRLLRKADQFIPAWIQN